MRPIYAILLNIMIKILYAVMNIALYLTHLCCNEKKTGESNNVKNLNVNPFSKRKKKDRRDNATSRVVSN